MSEWQGEGAFFDGQTSRREPVQIKIDAQGISMRREGEAGFSPVGKFRVAQRGKNSHLRIEAGRFPGGTIVLHSAEAEAALETNGFLRARLFSGVPEKRKIVLMGGLLILILFFLFTYGLDAIIDRGLALVPESTEEKLGRTIFDELVGRRVDGGDESTRRVLEKCAAVIQAFDTTRSWKIKIVIVEDEKTKNAFALPGGYIVVYRGILDAMADESELFGLLAHEAGHVYLRHGLRRIARTAMIGFIASVLFGDASGLSAVLFDNSEMLLNLAYNRTEERAADEYAIVALGKAGINQRGLATLFEKIKREEGDSRWLTFLSSHPATEERIAFLQQGLENDTPSRIILTSEEWKILAGRP
ncbi:MAG: M48 family metallopeptidase [bacterium]